MRFGSVCSGIEAASVAWYPIGWAAAWLAEIEAFPSAVLAHHYPDVPNLGDMTKIAARILAGEVEAPDVLVGGTPCQAFSVAGLRKSLDDERGQLSLAFIHLADSIDTVRRVSGRDASIVVWENVPGVLSTSDNAFGCFLGGLVGEECELQPAGKKWANAGCVYGPKRAAAWRILDAQYFGVAQRRRRVFVVASARNGFDPAAVLFEFEGVRRDSAPRRQAGEDAAGCLASRTDGGDFPGTEEACGGYVQPVASTGDVSHCLNAGGMGRQDYETETLVTHSLRGEGFDASEDGTGRGTPLVPVHVPEIAGTMKACKDSGGWSNSADHAAAGYMVPVLPFDTTQITSKTNGSNPQPGDPCHPLARGAHAPAIAFDCKASGQNGFGVGEVASTMRSMSHSNSHQNGGGHLAVAFQSSQSGVRIGEAHATLDSNNGSRRHNGVVSGMQVRRLTPRECERLQGFEDGYTAIEWFECCGTRFHVSLGKYGCPNCEGEKMAKHKTAADGPRYKALGNSMAVPVMAWIGRRIQMVNDATQGRE